VGKLCRGRTAKAGPGREGGSSKREDSAAKKRHEKKKKSWRRSQKRKGEDSAFGYGASLWKHWGKKKAKEEFTKLCQPAHLQKKNRSAGKDKKKRGNLQRQNRKKTRGRDRIRKLSNFGKS